jgi:hypothetical protein
MISGLKSLPCHGGGWWGGSGVGGVQQAGGGGWGRGRRAVHAASSMELKVFFNQ